MSSSLHAPDRATGPGAEPGPRSERPTSQPPARKARRRPWLKPFVMRLHFYAGVFVAPFILLAALTGAAYALSPTIEKVVYAHELHGSGQPGDAVAPLQEQIAAAQAFTSNATITAVRSAPDPSHSTRVLYADPTDPDGGSRTVFVDPMTSEVLGSFNTYTSLGQTPLRHWLEGFHSSLHLGEIGQKYSEVAASWLGIIAAAGLFLWLWTFKRTKRAAKRELLLPALKQRGGRRARSLHTSLGAWLLLAMLFLSATGITWSQWAGANVGELRAALSWTSPSLNPALGETEGDGGSSHHDHGASAAPDTGNQWSDPAAFTQVLALARQANIDGVNVEIRPPANAETAWVVKETRAQAPVKADQVAIDRANGTVVDRVDFDRLDLASKLTTWGINLHMGELFGVWNQAALFLAAVGIILAILAGYRAWFLRRPEGLRFMDKRPAFRAGDVPWWGWLAWGLGGLALGLFLPALGLTLLLFVVLDAARLLLGAENRRRRSGARG